MNSYEIRYDTNDRRCLSVRCVAFPSHNHCYVRTIHDVDVNIVHAAMQHVMRIYSTCNLPEPYLPYSSVCHCTENVPPWTAMNAKCESTHTQQCLRVQSMKAAALQLCTMFVREACICCRCLFCVCVCCLSSPPPLQFEFVSRMRAVSVAQGLHCGCHANVHEHSTVP